MKKTLIGTTILATLVLAMLALPALAQSPTNLVQNGSFEDGFVTGLGVANNWEHFASGNVDPGFYDDTWNLVVADGEHAQLIELIDSTATDTYAGIYQTVTVQPGQAYRLSFQGLVRSTEGNVNDSGWGYRMQYAVDQTGNTDWQAVSNWVELPWDEEPRTAPANGTAYIMHTEVTTFTATGSSVTLFFRAWKKWASAGEGNYDLDAVELIPVDATVTNTALPETGGTQTAKSNWGVIAGGASAGILALLLAGAFINQKRRRDEV